MKHEVSFSLEQTQRGREGEWVVLTVAGCLDHQNAPVLRDRVIGLLSEGYRCFVLDLQGVDFLDSSGLGVLVGGLKRARQAGGSLQLVCTQHPVLKVLRVTGLIKVFSIHPSVDRATAVVGACADSGAVDPDRDGSAA